MKCPKCGMDQTAVIRSRPYLDGKAIARRRECLVCGFRFDTCEVPATLIRKKREKRNE